LTVAGEKLLLHFHRADGQPSQRKIETLCLADAQDFAKILCRCHRHERELGARLAPSATCPSETVLPIRLRPVFSVIFKGYAGGPEHRPPRQEGPKRSPRADILWT
jgi:hypothetical protein